MGVAEYQPLVGDADVQEVLLQGETVQYAHTLPKSAQFKKPVFIFVTIMLIAMLGIFIVEPIALGAPWTIAVGLAGMAVIPVGLLFILVPGKITHVVTNQRVLTHTLKWGGRTTNSLFHTCVREVCVEKKKVIFKPKFDEAVGRYKGRNLMEFTDEEDPEYVQTLVNRILKDQPHTGLAIKPATITTVNNVSDLTDRQRALLGEYLSENLGDSVQYVYIPSVWTVWKWYALGIVVEMFAMFWMMGWVMGGSRITGDKTNDSDDTFLLLLPLIISVSTIALIVPYFGFVFSLFNKAYVVTNKSVLVFACGMGLSVNNTPTADGRKRFYGSQCGNYMRTRYITPDCVATMTAIFKTNGDGSGSIWFGVEFLSGLVSAPGAAQIMQWIANTLRGHVDPTPTPYVPTYPPAPYTTPTYPPMYAPTYTPASINFGVM